MISKRKSFHLCLVLYIFGYDLDRITVNTVMKKTPQSFYDSLDNT